MPGNLNTSTISISPSVSTVYTVTVTDGNGCSSTASSQVLVNPLPSVSVTSAVICSGDSAKLIASGAVNYTWMPTGVLGSVLQVSPATTTTYHVTGYSSAGCANTVSAVVTINLKPIADFHVTGSGCAPVVTNFQNLSSIISGNLVYHWDFGDGTTSDLFTPPPHVYSNSGNYTIKLMVSSGNCVAMDVKPNIIIVYPDPIAGFIINNGAGDIVRPTVELTNTSSKSTINYWNFGDGTFDYSGNNNPQHTYSDSGTYTICLLITDTHGCIDSVCDDVTIKPTWSFYIPNAFTPNGDGINEGFIGQSVNIIEHEMWIYDRWGLNIYGTGKTRNPETAKPWNGRPNGSDQPVQNDVYVWVVRIKDVSGKSHQLIGHVTVVK
jgi:gliding motility-associated-like protein